MANVRGTAEHPTFTRNQRVAVTYGLLTNGHALARYGTRGRIVSRRHARRGWYGVELSNGTLVTAHVSALRVN